MKTFTKNLKFILLTLSLLLLVSCDSKHSEEMINIDNKGSGESSIEEKIKANKGVVSAGGGNYDMYAVKILRDSRLVLKRMVENTPSSFFANFPKGKQKQFLVDILSKEVEFRENAKPRDGQELLLDYDLDSKQLFYTRNFVRKFAANDMMNSYSGKLISHKNLIVYLIHEISHFYALGTSSATNGVSELFARRFFSELLSDVSVCEIQKTDKSLIINPQTGFSFIVMASEMNLRNYSDNTSAYPATVNFGQNQSYFYGKPLPVFALAEQISEKVYKHLVNNSSETGWSSVESFTERFDHNDFKDTFLKNGDKSFKPQVVVWQQRGFKEDRQTESVLRYKNRRSRVIDTKYLDMMTGDFDANIERRDQEVGELVEIRELEFDGGLPAAESSIKKMQSGVVGLNQYAYFNGEKSSLFDKNYDLKCSSNSTAFDFETFKELDVTTANLADYYYKNVDPNLQFTSIKDFYTSHRDLKKEFVYQKRGCVEKSKDPLCVTLMRMER